MWNTKHPLNRAQVLFSNFIFSNIITFKNTITHSIFKTVMNICKHRKCLSNNIFCVAISLTYLYSSRNDFTYNFLLNTVKLNAYLYLIVYVVHTIIII